VVEIYAEYHDNFDTKMNVSKLGLRLSPGIDKYFQVGASFISCSKDGKIVRYENQADGEDQSFIKGDVILAYRIPWFLDYRLTVRGGLMEGKPGGGVDFLMYDWGLFSYPVQFSFEIRDAYNSVKNEDIDEQISGPLMRGYVKAPLWIRKGAWYETLLSTARIYAGVNRLGKDPEFSAGISVEWADDDIKTLVGFITLSR
jgi:hypothetical protein